MQSKNNLKNIGLANHNYHDVYGNFPPAGKYLTGLPPNDPRTGVPHSWQVELLPYLEQLNLYETYTTSFGKTWDAVERHGSLQISTNVYKNPNIQGHDHLANGFAATHYAGNSRFYNDKGLGVRECTGGTSNVFMAGEVNNAFASWGDPANLRDPSNGFGNSPNQFGNADGRDETAMLMADGSVRPISSSVNAEVLKQLAALEESPMGGF